MSQLQFQCPASPMSAAPAPLQLGQPQPGYSIPCASGTLPSESASQPIRSSALPAGSATPYNTTTGLFILFFCAQKRTTFSLANICGSLISNPSLIKRCLWRAVCTLQSLHLKYLFYASCFQRLAMHVFLSCCQTLGLGSTFCFCVHDHVYLLSCEYFLNLIFAFVTVSNMANPKEKTPMCLVNELARFNKIQPEYKLLCEQGPAHSKVLWEYFLKTTQWCNFIYAVVFFCHKFMLLTRNLLYFLCFLSLSDFLSQAHTGRSALGSRGDQHQESPAFRCCFCPRWDDTSQAHHEDAPQHRQEPRWALPTGSVAASF